MKAIQGFAVLCMVLCCCRVAFAKEIDFHLRRLHQQAAAGASGSQSAQSSAVSSNIGGQQQAGTSATATGGQATTFGISQAAGQTDTCFQGPTENYSTCRTLAPSYRSSNCTNVPPDDRYSCQQQAVEFKKCSNDFIFVGSWCLQSCNRCGDQNCNDNDKPADGSSCDASKCDSAAYKQRPTCLKRCGRCSTVAAA